MLRFSTYDEWKLASPDDIYADQYGEEPEFEPELFPVDLDDLEFLMPTYVASVAREAAE